MTGSRVNIDNCIFYFNTASQYAQIGDAGSENSVCYSCIEGGFVGIGNVSTNPQFTDRPNDDYTIGVSTSDVVDGGNNDDTNGATVDLAGNDRKVDGDGDQTETVDMGAYEFIPAP
jgi:hypothetical protein